ncbi:MAG: hypothetical protein M1813_008970 [Trichoglossum hirsutum]|nr:MAG: hypothetical protein M1813_008970 [Trichoglossum hirsutum]
MVQLDNVDDNLYTPKDLGILAENLAIPHPLPLSPFSVGDSPISSSDYEPPERIFASDVSLIQESNGPELVGALRDLMVNDTTSNYSTERRSTQLAEQSCVPIDDDIRSTQDTNTASNHSTVRGDITSNLSADRGTQDTNTTSNHSTERDDNNNTSNLSAEFEEEDNEKGNSATVVRWLSNQFVKPHMCARGDHEHEGPEGAYVGYLKIFGEKLETRVLVASPCMPGCATATLLVPPSGSASLPVGPGSSKSPDKISIPQQPTDRPVRNLYIGAASAAVAGDRCMRSGPAADRDFSR